MRSVWPYVLAPFVFVAYIAYERFTAHLAEVGVREPNEAAGQTWEIAFRGDGVRYVQLWEYIAFVAPFYVVPAVMIVGLLMFLIGRRKN